MFKRFSTRQRAIFSSFLIGIVFFLALSPVSSYIYELILPPTSVKNVHVTQKSGEVALKWDFSPEFDVVGYRILVNGEDEIILNQTVDNHIVSELENGKGYRISLEALDNSNRSSEPVLIDVSPSEDKTVSSIVNSYDYLERNQNTIMILSFVFTALIFFLTQWVLFFKLKGEGLFAIGLYPSVALLPYILLTSSIFFTINSPFNKTLFITGVSVGAVFLSYIILLTSNILNGSLKAHIPLEQAAKASQFIISLLSAYLVLIYAFGSGYSMSLKFAIVLPFIFYFTYSGIWILKSLDRRQVLIRSTAITLLMALAILIISIWPINIIYTILACSVIYYILLNIALEYRAKLNFNYWFEYVLLIALISVLLLTSASWGINGTIV